MLNYIIMCIVPLMILFIIVIAAKEKKDIFKLFIEGALDGLKVVYNIFPYILAITISIGLLKSTGALDVILYPFKPLLVKFGIPEDIIAPIYVGIIGWIDIKVTKMVEAGQPITISLEDYQKQLRALYREHNQKHSLMTYSVEPSNQEIEQEFQKKRVYIEQLDIIDCDYTEKVEAINDYLRAAIDRATWAENGDISMQSIKTYESNLKRTWKLQKRIVMLEKKNESSENQGKMIYYKCQDKNVEMDSVYVPDFFKNGCYHALANALEIGWHPQYWKLIKEESDRWEI